MSVECPDCKDVSRYATDGYKPYCKLVRAEVDRWAFESYCKKYPGYRDCPVRREKYGR